MLSPRSIFHPSLNKAARDPLSHGVKKGQRSLSGGSSPLPVSPVSITWSDSPGSILSLREAEGHLRRVSLFVRSHGTYQSEARADHNPDVFWSWSTSPPMAVSPGASFREDPTGCRVLPTDQVGASYRAHHPQLLPLQLPFLPCTPLSDTTDTSQGTPLHSQTCLLSPLSSEKGRAAGKAETGWRTTFNFQHQEAGIMRGDLNRSIPNLVPFREGSSSAQAPLAPPVPHIL